MQREATLLGSVRNVRGGTVLVAVESETPAGLAFIDGEGYRIGQVGSFARVPIGYTDLFGIIVQVGSGPGPAELVGEWPEGQRWLVLELVGEASRNAELKRGLSLYPTIGDAVHLVTRSDLARIYGPTDSAGYVPVGHVAGADNIPALVSIDQLVTRHAAVLGATGAGKSTTVAGLLESLSNPAKYPSARILVFDIHGEYATALGDRSIVFRINPNLAKAEQALEVPYWALTYDELLPITLGALDDSSRGYVLEQILSLKRATLERHPYPGVEADSVTVDTPIPFSIHQLWFDLFRTVNATHKQSGGQSRETETLLMQDGKPVQPGDPMAVIPPRYRPHSQASGEDKIYLPQSAPNIRRHVDALTARLRDQRFNFLFRPGEFLPNVDGVPAADLDDVLERWLGGDRPVRIFDLSGVPSSVLTQVIGSFLRLIYDAMFWARNLSEGARERPILFVLEEAHAYLGEEAGGAGAAVRRIVKEGRKYGMGAMLVSQRPSEIDPTVLSQCGTLFCMRMANRGDRGHVVSSATDGLEGLFATLPVLRTGEAIIVGEAVRLPVRTLIDPPPPHRRPDSDDPKVYVADSGEEGPESAGGWNRNTDEAEDYEEVVRRWRVQNAITPRPTTEKP
jgi:uncharacterized protein